MQRSIVVIVAVLCFAGCGAHHETPAQKAKKVQHGMTRAEVRSLLGAPRREGPRCWLYSWAAEGGSAVDGERICFERGRVALTQIPWSLSA